MRHRVAPDVGVEHPHPLAVQLGTVRLRGILSHAGHGYGAQSPAEAAAIATEEAHMMTTLAAEVTALGVAVDEISVGATPAKETTSGCRTASAMVARELQRAGLLHPARAKALLAPGALVLLALLLMALLPAPAGAATRAWLDRDSITLGETVTLNVETDQVDAELDFSVLQPDFVLLGTSSRTQVNMGSGGRSVSALRAVALEPRRSGEVVIPALAVGSETTQPITLTVLAAAPATGPEPDAGQDVFLQIEIEPRNPYVQQQVRYTLRLFYAVTLLEGQLEEPAAEHIEVRRLGQDRSEQRVIDGRRYNVVERHYALVPERSGRLVIPPAVFRGRAILPGRRGTWLGAGSPVSARGEEIALQVKPRPQGGAEPWLPASELSLEDSGGALPDSVRAGEPLTLTLRIRARGLAAAQLPVLELPRIAGAEVYPDQPVTRDGNEGPWLVGEVERKFAIVPHAAGTLELPAVEVHWWDTDSDQAQVARLDPRRVQVLPALAGAEAAGAPVVQPDSAGAPTPPQSSHWPLLAIGFALLWIATLAAWALERRRQRRHPTRPLQAAADPARGAATASLKKALASGDLAAIAAALRALAATQHLPARSLGELATQLEPQQQRALQAIEAARYGDGDRDAALQLARSAFARGILAVRTQARPAAQPEPLPPLYP